MILGIDHTTRVTAMQVIPPSKTGVSFATPLVSEPVVRELVIGGMPRAPVNFSVMGSGSVSTLLSDLPATYPILLKKHFRIVKYLSNNDIDNNKIDIALSAGGALQGSHT